MVDFEHSFSAVTTYLNCDDPRRGVPIFSSVFGFVFVTSDVV
jgi:hypothetical protein